MDREVLEQIKHHLTNLQKVITFGATFKFFEIYLIKKNKIDDIYVCLLSLLPKSFKTALNIQKFEEVPSVICYKMLFNSIKGKFPLDKNLYVVQHKTAIKSIQDLIQSMEKDFEHIEKNL